MGIISSRHNPLVKRIREAIREHAEEIVIEGPKAVRDAIAGGWHPIAVVERDVDMSGDVFDSLAETKSPQNVIGLFERPRGDANAILARHDTIAIALDGVQVSRRYPGGVALRFARVRQYRADKTAADVDPIEAVQAMLP